MGELNEENVIDLIVGLREMKLNSAEAIKQWMVLQGYHIDTRALTTDDLLHDLVEQVKEDCETFWRLHYTGKSDK